MTWITVASVFCKEATQLQAERSPEALASCVALVVFKGGRQVDQLIGCRSKRELQRSLEDTLA